MIYKAYRFMGVKGGVKGSDGVKVAPRGSTGRLGDLMRTREQWSVRTGKLRNNLFLSEYMCANTKASIEYLNMKPKDILM